jgi:hypothetical protein
MPRCDATPAHLGQYFHAPSEVPRGSRSSLKTGLFMENRNNRRKFSFSVSPSYSILGRFLSLYSLFASISTIRQ